MDTVVNNERGGPDKCTTEPERFRIRGTLVRAVAGRKPSDVSSVEQRAVDPTGRDVNSAEQRAVDPRDGNNVGPRAAEPRVTIRVARGPVGLVGLGPPYFVGAVAGGRP
jgi:hypothetical protein